MELLCTPTVQLIVLPPREEYRSPLRKTSVFLNWEKYASLSTSKPGIVGRGMADDSSQSHTPAIRPCAYIIERIMSNRTRVFAIAESEGNEV